MEEDIGVKAPVTRLRRRLSAERTDDVKSPVTPSTPTKKRGGRLAVKPDLELIEENAPVSSPRRPARKSIVKDLTDPTDNKTTPSRRSTRNKSNTSLVSESAIIVDSPRAKRAARRISQAGSDNETPFTPSRQTRRTRKESTSSVENQETLPATKTKPFIEVNVEKFDTISGKPTVHAKTPEPIIEKEIEGIRKSPRIAKKGNRTESDGIYDDDGHREKKDKISSELFELETNTNQSVISDKNNLSNNNLEKHNLSILDVDLIKKLDLQSKKFICKPNKTTSAIEITNKEENKRHRTKSWSTISTAVLNSDSSFFSDNEGLKKNKLKINKKKIEIKNSSDDNLKQGIKNIKQKINCNLSLESTIEPNQNSNDSNPTTNLFKKGPISDMQAIVYIESDSESKEKFNIRQPSYNEDQCVPVVKDQLVNNQTLHTTLETDPKPSNHSFEKPNIDNDSMVKVSNNDTCEPMDVDETIPNDASVIISTEEHDLNDQNDQKRNKSIHISLQEHCDYNITSDTKKMDNIKKDCFMESENNFYNKSKISESDIDGNLNTVTKNNADETKKVSGFSFIIDDCGNNDDKNIASDNNNTTINTPNRKSSEFDSNTESSVNKLRNNEHLRNSFEKESPATEVVCDDDTIIQEQSEQKFPPANVKLDRNDKSLKKSKRKSILNIKSEQKSNESLISSSMQSSSAIIETRSESEESIYKSKENYSVSQSLDKIANENKSTLILSQIKNSSCTENNLSKSPKTSNVELLSKSINDNVSSKTKKNISLSELTRTPLQQKNIQKLGIQTSTPVNSNIMDIHTSQENVRPKNENKSNTESSNSEEEVEEESSKEKNYFIDDEAEATSDNYESGDSQEEDEKQYLMENELVDKGETLTSEDEISHDSDYEKDSFVVSSADEDNELLSGSGDDLSLSDNELTMTAKSKKKYNERKLKEQKKASREMYEARHNISIKSKKSNRRRLDSSLLESEDEIVQPKRKNRLRLDSCNNDTKDTSNVIEKSESRKKRKHLSDSFRDKSAFNEKEITICDESMTKKNDPLEILIKQEKSTPRKDLDITAINYTVREEIEEIHVDKYASLVNERNESVDPLHITNVKDDNSHNEDEEMQDNELNTIRKEPHKNTKSNKNKIKSHDISLPLDLKNKHKSKESIVDQLNLTVSKKSKKSKKSGTSDTVTDSISSLTQNKVKAIQKSSKKSQNVDDNEDTSSVINFQLLFSEDSNDMEEKDDGITNLSQGTTEDFIPLKRTEGKTNIFENMSDEDPDTVSNIENCILEPDLIDSESISENEEIMHNYNSVLKELNKKSKEHDKDSVQQVSVPEDIQDLDISKNNKLNISNNDKNNENSSQTIDIHMKEISSKDVLGLEISDIDSDDAPLDVPYVSEKNQERFKQLSKVIDNDVTIDNADDAKIIKSAVNKYSNKTQKNKKKKNKSLSKSQTIDQTDTKAVAEKSSTLPLKLHKQKQNITSEIEVDETSGTKQKTVEKIKHKSSVISDHDERTISKNRMVNTIEDKKNKSSSHTMDSKKKEKGGLSDNVTANLVLPFSSKITEHKKKTKDKPIERSGNEHVPAVEAEHRIVSVVSTDKQKILESTSKQDHTKDKIKSNKRKRKFSASNDDKQASVDAFKDVNQSPNKDTKKCKLSQNYENIVETRKKVNSQETKKVPFNELKEANKKITEHDERKKEQNAKSTLGTSKNKIHKKRKYREDDDSERKLKVQKQNFFSKVHVSRLPDDILNKLNENPKKEITASTKSKVISTTAFVVEETKKRKNKPSNYLEETICLNAESPEVKKYKNVIKKPKVLPFMPTASIADNGFTTNFKVKVMSQETDDIVAKTEKAPNFKHNHLYGSKIKRLNTYATYKQFRNIKLSKF